MPRDLGLCVLFLGSGVALPAYGQVELAWKFSEGDRFYAEVVATQKQSFETKGRRNSTESTETKVWSIEVKKTALDLVLAQRIESWTVKGTSPYLRLPPKLLERMKGVTFTITLSPAGKIAKFEGYDEVVKRLETEVLLVKLLKTALPEQAFQSEAEMLISFLPENPVEKGDMWKTTSTQPLGLFGALRLDHQFRYRGKEKDGDVIEDTAAMTFVLPKGDFGGLPVKVLKGEFKSDGLKGHYVFDAGRGRLIRARTTLNFQGSLTMESGGERAELNLEAQHTETIRVLDKWP
jgi:hypothetical protein